MRPLNRDIEISNKNFTLENLDGIEKQLLFYVIEEKDLAVYQKMNQNAIFVLLPDVDLHPCVILELTKLVAEHFEFP